MSPAARLALLSLALVAAADEGFTPLFDGRSTEGWTPIGTPGENWVVEDGLLITRGKGGGWLGTETTYGDFDLRLEYRLQPGGNSGVNIRSPREGDPAYTGMEIQILDDAHPRYKNIRPAQHTGSIYDVVPARLGHSKPAGEWNAMEINARGPKVTVRLNGATIVEADLEEHSDALDKHPGLARPEGYIGLQSHNEPVEFRNIAIRTDK